MIGEFLLRLAVALPLVLLLAVATIWALRRGWLRLPTGGLARFAGNGAFLPFARQASHGFDLIACRGIQPGIQLLLLRHGGQELLIGVSPQGLSLLSARPAAIDPAGGEA